MSALSRFGNLKLIPFPSITGLCKNTERGIPQINQIVFISGKALREGRPPRPAPFDWKNKRYNFWHVWTDSMVERMDDNSKIVIVEGLPSVGKEKFARKLAEELEMEYMEAPTFDDFHIDASGFDYRSLNSKLPLQAQYYDDTMFHENPKGRLSACIQLSYYMFKFSAYIDALTHVLSTGQGVVMPRSPMSDIVFAKAMFTNDYISFNAYDYYKSSIANSLHRLLKPHLVVYLDIPAEKSLENIKKYGLPYEKNSKALTLNYLKDIEKNYKEIHLPSIAKHAHMLIYDWNEEGDMDFIIDDIEGLQFEGYGREDSKMDDWRFSSPDWMRTYRDIYHNHKSTLMQTLTISRFDVPEILVSGQDVALRKEILEKVHDEIPSTKYADGYDPATNNVWWKTGYSRAQPKRIKKAE